MKFRKQKHTAVTSRGQAIVEFAIVLPILMMLLVGILEVGRLIYTYAAIINASREAVRYASAVGRDDNGKTKYNYCAGIEERARRSAYFVPNRSVSIQYQFSGGTTDTCIPNDGDGSDTGITVSSGDRVIVTVSGDYVALVKLIPIPSKTLTSSSARTVLGIVEMDAPSSGGSGSGGGGGGTPVATTPPGTLTAIALSNTPTATNTPTSTPTSTATSSGQFATFTPINTTLVTPVTSTSTSTPTMTFTPTATSTAVPGCNGLTYGNIVISGSSMQITIQNPHDAITVQDIQVTWNHDGGAGGQNPALSLQSIKLGVYSWTVVNGTGPTAKFTPVPAMVIPGNNLSSTITLAFSKAYKNIDGTEAIAVTLSTSGCENYPIQLPKPTATPTSILTATPTMTTTPTITFTP